MKRFADTAAFEVTGSIEDALRRAKESLRA